MACREEHDEKGQTQEILCVRCTRLDLVRDVLRARPVRDDLGRGVTVRCEGFWRKYVAHCFFLRPSL